MMRRILFLIAFLSIALVISAQRNCFFTHYSSEDGLSQNTVMTFYRIIKEIFGFRLGMVLTVLMAILLKHIRHVREILSV